MDGGEGERHRRTHSHGHSSSQSETGSTPGNHTPPSAASTRTYDRYHFIKQV